jgi:hypothetical protein
MFSLAVRLAIGITCSVLLFSDALGEGPVSYLLMLVMLLAAIWKWTYRLVRLITGTSAAISRKALDEPERAEVSEQVEERIRLAALQQSQLKTEQADRTDIVHQTNMAPIVFGKRR